jgi:hypothetical protein
MVPDLDALGILHGTDKSSIAHDYLRHYERVLGRLRHEPITLLEIGVFRGSSLATWKDFMPNATVVGLDINPDCARYAGGRSVVEIGSQADPEFLRSVMQRHRPTVVIDDGSHLADHVISTFQALYPMLPPGGVYIAEDIHFHAGAAAPRWRNGSADAPQDVFLRLARLVSCPATEGDDGRPFMHMTDSVEFCYGAVVVRRRPARSGDDIQARRTLVERANRPKTWANFALHVFNNTGDLADAVACVHRAIDMEPKNSEHWDILSVIYERAGQIDDSARAAAEATHVNPADRRLAERARSMTEQSDKSDKSCLI